MPDQSLPLRKIKERQEPPSDQFLRMPIGKAIFTLAWPATLTVLLENLATTVDMIMVGRLGAAEVAAVGFSSMIYWLLSSLLIGIEAAATAIVARKIGANKVGEANTALAQCLVLAFVMAAVVAALAFSLAPQIFGLFGIEPDVFELSVSYLRILCISQVFFSVVVVGSGALRGAGDTRTPMYIMLAGTVVHIVINYLLILGNFGFPQLGVDGAAIGTAISMAVTAFLYLWLLFQGNLRLRLLLEDFKWNWHRTWQTIRIAVPASAEMIVLQLGLLFYAKFIVAFGTIALSGYQVGMQILSLSFIPHTGFGIAASTLIGQNLGAERKKEAKQAGWICVFWGALSMGVLGIFYMIFARELASIFVDNAEVVEVAAIFIRVTAICQAAMSIHFTLSGALRGAGDTRSPLYITVLGMYGVRVPAVWIGTVFFGMGITGAFSLLIFDYILRNVIILTRYTRGKWLETKI
jgi:putative MATE family efflux protein